MHPSSAKIQHLLQQKNSAVWLLVFIYALSSSYYSVHVHSTPHKTVNSFDQVLFEHLPFHELSGQHDHQESDAHDCTACKLQFKSLATNTLDSLVRLKTEHERSLPATRSPFRKTPTKRLTRAPPVA